LRTAVCRMDRGPAVNSCSSRRAISYSLKGNRRQHWGVEAAAAGLDIREVGARLVLQLAGHMISVRTGAAGVMTHRILASDMVDERYI
jgi:hypothetical protein